MKGRVGICLLWARKNPSGVLRALGARKEAQLRIFHEAGRYRFFRAGAGEVVSCVCPARRADFTIFVSASKWSQLSRQPGTAAHKLLGYMRQLHGRGSGWKLSMGSEVSQ
jgi:hypothetical protein